MLREQMVEILEKHNYLSRRGTSSGRVTYQGALAPLGEEKKNMYNVIWKDKYGEIIIAEDFDNGSNIDVVVRGEEK